MKVEDWLSLVLILSILAGIGVLAWFFKKSSPASPKIHLKLKKIPVYENLEEHEIYEENGVIKVKVKRRVVKLPID